MRNRITWTFAEYSFRFVPDIMHPSDIAGENEWLEWEDYTTEIETWEIWKADRSPRFAEIHVPKGQLVCSRWNSRDFHLFAIEFLTVLSEVGDGLKANSETVFLTSKTLTETFAFQLPAILPTSATHAVSLFNATNNSDFPDRSVEAYLFASIRGDLLEYETSIGLSQRKGRPTGPTWDVEKNELIAMLKSSYHRYRRKTTAIEKLAERSDVPVGKNAIRDLILFHDIKDSDWMFSGKESPEKQRK